MRKNFLSLVLVLALVSSLFTSVPVSAASSGTYGTNITWILDDNYTLTISGTGDMKDPSVGNNVPWHSSSKLIKSVIIESGITSICRGAFEECYILSDITIPDSVKSIGHSGTVLISRVV